MTKPEIILGVYLFPDEAKKCGKGAWGKHTRLIATASCFKIKSQHTTWQAVTSNRIYFGTSCQELLIPFTHSPWEVQFPVANWCPDPDPASVCSHKRPGLGAGLPAVPVAAGPASTHQRFGDVVLTNWTSCLELSVPR